MKKNGFTMVEVIVVSVIVAIIATTATMLYTGYIRESRQTTVENLAKTAAASANAYYRKTGMEPIPEDLKLFEIDQDRYTPYVTGPRVTVVDNDNDGVTAVLLYVSEGTVFLPREE